MAESSRGNRRVMGRFMHSNWKVGSPWRSRKSAFALRRRDSLRVACRAVAHATALISVSEGWCGRKDSNLHGIVTRQPLKLSDLLRLPTQRYGACEPTADPLDSTNSACLAPVMSGHRADVRASDLHLVRWPGTEVPRRPAPGHAKIADVSGIDLIRGRTASQPRRCRRTVIRSRAWTGSQGFPATLPVMPIAAPR